MPLEVVDGLGLVGPWPARGLIGLWIEGENFMAEIYQLVESMWSCRLFERTYVAFRCIISLMVG